MISGRSAALALTVLLLTAVLAPVLASDPKVPGVYVPQWRVGQSWTVECDVPDPLVAKIPPWIDGRKLGTARRPRWVFTVEKVSDLTPKLRLFKIVVRGPDPGVRSSADLVFGGRIETGGRIGSLYLYKAEYRYPAGKSVNTVRKDYNRMSAGPFPVTNDVNDIPCDFPYLDITFNPGPDAKADGVWREFKATDVVEGDLRSRSVRQTILFATSKMQMGERIKVPIQRELNQDVYMRHLGSRGNETVRLVFNPAFPWPIYGEGPRGKFWVVK